MSIGAGFLGGWRRCLCGLLLLMGLSLAAAQAPQRLVVSPQGTPMSLQDAVRQARDGDIIELLPGEYRGTLELAQRRLTLRGVGEKAPVVRGEEQPGEARGLWLVRGGEVTIENVEFRGARSSEGSGAGVRHEGGKLVLRQCVFFDNEHGVFSANDATAELHIENSVIGRAPRVVGGLYHLLNVGRIARLSISGSRFQQGFEGHLIKSRARETDIRYNFIHDGQRGGASYEIEIAGGGQATLIGNVIAQGSETQNPVLVAYGTEGRTWERNQLLMAHNTLVHYGWLPGWFVRVFYDNLPADTEVVVLNNLLVGPALFWPGWAAHSEGNRRATLGMLRDTETYAFELPPGSVWRNGGVDPRQWGGRDLAPKAEFKWPVGVEPLADRRDSWSPGAYQR